MAGVSESLISHILAGNKRPSWKTAKLLAEVTGIDERDWMEGDQADLKKKLERD